MVKYFLAGRSRGRFNVHVGSLSVSRFVDAEVNGSSSEWIEFRVLSRIRLCRLTGTALFGSVAFAQTVDGADLPSIA